MTHAERNKRWRRSHPEAVREQNRRYRLKLKLECFEHYGGAHCCVPGCPESDLDHLELDHIEGNGNKDRAERIGQGMRSPGGWVFYAALRKAGYPPGFCVKCIAHHDEKHGRSPSEERKRCSPAMDPTRPYDDNVPF